VLRRASRLHIISRLDEARRLIPLAETDGVWRMVAKNPDVIQAVCPSPNGTPIGLFAYLPLSAYGAATIVGGGFDGGLPDPAWICRAGERPEAIYWWLFHTPGKLARMLGAVSALCRELAPQGVPIFSRAVTAASERLQLSVGFLKARDFYPDAPAWLLVALPEGRLPESRSESPATRIEVRIVRNMAELTQVFALRSATYIAEQFCTYEEEFDGNDFCATQFIAYVGGDPAGAIRLRYFGDFVKLERLCVRREYRRLGVKEKVIQAAIDHARAKRFRKMYGHARFDLVDMWREFGFEPIPGRPPFRFANIDYVEILRDLEPDDAAIKLGVPPMMTTRPEGLWDEPGPLDLSNLAHDPARLNLLQKHTRFRA
jgi:predicted GNAT family N-acyltransferase